MEKYQSYKPSGVEWIGDIPEHWKKCRLKNVSKSVNGYSFKSDDFDREFDIPVIRIGDVGDKIDFEDCIKVKSDFLTDKKDFIVFRNDILIGLTGGTIGKSGRYNYDTPSLLNQRVGLLRNNKDLLNGLLYHYVKSEVFIRYIFFDCYGGGQDNISMNDILKMVLPLPPLKEQHQIVQFLDSKTELIDRLILTKERKITLLKEQRTSLINQVVTKGLNPNVKMKDSGVEWIGEIPGGWNVKRVKYLLKELEGIKIGPFGSSLKLDTLSESGIKVYGQGNVIKDDFSLGERYIPLNRFESDFSQYEISEGDVLVTMMGTTGKCKVFSKDFERGILDSHLLRLRFDKTKFNSQLFSVILEQSNYLYNQIKLMSKGSIMEGLNSSIVKELFIFTPSIEEQSEILKYLNSKTKEIDDLVQLEQKKIDLLKEYRQSLISEVITGKIKVTTDE
jgi:type I restriction enzyme S subunit